MKSLCFISVAPPIRSSPFLSVSRASLNRFTLKIPASLYLSPPRCSYSNPSSSEGLLDSHGGMSRASITAFEDTSLNEFKMQVGSPISLHSINPLAKLSLSDKAFFLLAFTAFTVLCSTTSFFFIYETIWRLAKDSSILQFLNVFDFDHFVDSWIKWIGLLIS